MLFVRPTTMADRGVSGAGKALRCLLIAASLIAAAGRGGRGEKMWSAADAIGRVRVGKYADTGSHPPARMADERRGASRAEVLLQASSGDAGGRLEDGWTSSVSPSANDLSRDEVGHHAYPLSSVLCRDGTRCLVFPC